MALERYGYLAVCDRRASARDGLGPYRASAACPTAETPATSKDSDELEAHAREVRTEDPPADLVPVESAKPLYLGVLGSPGAREHRDKFLARQISRPTRISVAQRCWRCCCCCCCCSSSVPLFDAQRRRLTAGDS